MKKMLLIGLLALSAAGAAQAAGMSEHAENAAVASGSAVVASGVAATEAAIASGQLVSGVAALPLKGVGAVGKVADSAGDALLSVATDEPLPISEESVTASPAPKTE